LKLIDLYQYLAFLGKTNAKTFAVIPKTVYLCSVKRL